ncbi:MAG: hypothetical protein LBU16_10190 [Treponema sp.]|jgi:hypothetical protein|nr:hypothetical protein [Treponema sp.]
MKRHTFFGFGMAALLLAIGWGAGACDSLIGVTSAAATYSVATGENARGTTIALMFAFSEEVTGLAVGDIIIKNGPGVVTKGTLTGGGTSWRLGITVNTAGDITVAINKNGIESVEKTVKVYAY